MVNKVEYQLKTDKRGHEYALKTDIKTGKSTRIAVKTAKKRIADNKYRRARDKLEPDLIARGSNWREYRKAIKLAEKDVLKKEAERILKEKTGKEQDKYEKASPKRQKKIRDELIKETRMQKKTIRKRAEERAIELKVGLKTRYRFMYRYWNAQCDTPIFYADAYSVEGDRYDDFVEEMEQVHAEVYSTDLCPNMAEPVQGGSCVVLYHKIDGTIVKHHGLGDGCSKH